MRRSLLRERGKKKGEGGPVPLLRSELLVGAEEERGPFLFSSTMEGGGNVSTLQKRANAQRRRGKKNKGRG